MDVQKKRKYGAQGLGALSLMLGVTAKGAHDVSKKGRAGAKLIRNVTGTGAVGTGIGAAYLAGKYYNTRKKAKDESHR